jgi:TPR repeat protein
MQPSGDDASTVNSVVTASVYSRDDDAGSGGVATAGSSVAAATVASGGTGETQGEAAPGPEDTSAEAEAEHLCPICMENADDAMVDGESCAQCFECGQLACGACKREMTSKMLDCPFCREPFFTLRKEGIRASIAANEKLQISQLKRLVYERPPGRHTPHAQYNLGVKYNLGDGVRQDYKEAIRLWTLATDQDLAEAFYNIGTMHDHGYGVRQDYTKAAEFYKRASDQGCREAQANLGSMYEDGDGVLQNFTEAARLNSLAAAQGHTKAQFDLGWAYDKGEGVSQDSNEAVRWYKLAVAKGYSEAQFSLSVIYGNGDGVAQDYHEAARLAKLAADQGHQSAVKYLPICHFNLGQAFLHGNGVNQDHIEAAKWYTLAAEKHHPMAQFKLGGLYCSGTSVPKDTLNGLRLIKLATEQGDAIDIAKFTMLLNSYFPVGARVKLVGLKAASLNGKCGVVVERGEAAAPALGRIVVQLDERVGTKAIPFEKLQRLSSVEENASHVATPFEDFFPPGTRVKLRGLKAEMLNGLPGVVVQPSGPTRVGGGSQTASPAHGKVTVLLDSGREQAVYCLNLVYA